MIAVAAVAVPLAVAMAAAIIPVAPVATIAAIVVPIAVATAVPVAAPGGIRRRRLPGQDWGRRRAPGAIAPGLPCGVRLRLRGDDLRRRTGPDTITPTLPGCIRLNLLDNRPGGGVTPRAVSPLPAALAVGVLRRRLLSLALDTGVAAPVSLRREQARSGAAASSLG